MSGRTWSADRSGIDQSENAWVRGYFEVNKHARRQERRGGPLRLRATDRVPSYIKLVNIRN